MENIEFNSFNTIINDLNFTILEHGYLHTGKEWNFKQLSSPFNRLYFIISGNGHIKNEHNALELIGGNAYIVPLNNICDYACTSELHKFYIHFRVELIPGHDFFEGRKEFKSLPVDLGVIQELINSAASNRVGDFIKCKGIFLDYIGRFILQYSDAIDEQIKLANNYIELYTYVEANCYADLRVKNIAKHLNMPVTNLSKNFKNDTGLTLKSYIDNKIIQKAQELLLTTTLPIKNISYELHFIDEFYFSRFFKNKTGLSPKRYRERSNTFK